MLITKEVMVGLSGKLVKYYEELGYPIPREKCVRGHIGVILGTKISVSVDDLPIQSKKRVIYKCDECGYDFETEWWVYLQYKKRNNDIEETYCQKCTHKSWGGKKYKENRLEKGFSFYQWCVDNDRLDLLDRWDYIKNKCGLDKVLAGDSKRKYYFYCPKNVHESELKSINNFTNGHPGVMDCLCCNSFGYKYSDLLFLWSENNEKSPFECSWCSSDNIEWVCENKKHANYKRKISTSHQCEFRCPKCVEENEESILQEKVREYLNVIKNFYNNSVSCEINHEFDCLLNCKIQQQIEVYLTITRLFLMNLI